MIPLIPKVKAPVRWACQWYSRNRMDGVDKHWIWHDGKPALFHARSEARAFIRERYGYIATRPDLRSEPHGWRMPRAIKVYVILRPATQKESPE